jgi:hypothetical protein
VREAELHAGACELPVIRRPVEGWKDGSRQRSEEHVRMARYATRRRPRWRTLDQRWGCEHPLATADHGTGQLRDAHGLAATQSAHISVINRRLRNGPRRVVYRASMQQTHGLTQAVRRAPGRCCKNSVHPERRRAAPKSKGQPSKCLCFDFAERCSATLNTNGFLREGDISLLAGIGDTGERTRPSGAVYTLVRTRIIGATRPFTEMQSDNRSPR